MSEPTLDSARRGAYKLSLLRGVVADLVQLECSDPTPIDGDSFPRLWVYTDRSQARRKYDEALEFLPQLVEARQQWATAAIAKARGQS